jgi:N-acetylglucosaminyldiphosphoundecaprenol N-acetyl-beta-D-mannosaminyltransferase
MGEPPTVQDGQASSSREDPELGTPIAGTGGGHVTAAAGRRDRVAVVGCHIDRVDMRQAVQRVDATIAEHRYTQHVAINAAKIVAMRHDSELRRVVTQCGFATADGQSVVWASRLLGQPLPCRVAGIDLMQELLALAERRGYRVYFLGAKADVLARGLERVRRLHPRLIIAGARDGYFADHESDDVAVEVAATNPHIVFVAMSSPRKEYWLGRHGPAVGAPFVMGVGGSIDVLSGVVRRAPVIMQRLGLEWLWRVVQEPRRLLGRYLVTNCHFIYLVMCEYHRRHCDRP